MLEMELLNGRMEESFPLRQGDAISVSVALVSGELMISIGQNGREPVYEGRNPKLGPFRVNIAEDGDYGLTISGKHAQGSVSFQIIRGAQKGAGQHLL